jgi:hypothetical protein
VLRKLHGILKKPYFAGSPQYVEIHRAIPFAGRANPHRDWQIHCQRNSLSCDWERCDDTQTESGNIHWKRTRDAIALVFLNATRAFSDPSVEQINAVVKACVETTRAQQAEWGAKPWFDAYYNAASGRVPDNVTNNLGLPSRFVFNKCMAERGFPLKD